MNAKVFASVFLALAAGASQAAAPTAVVSGSSASFAEYAGSSTVGDGLINTNTLFYIDEAAGSWYVFYEPAGVESLTATITFDSAITAVYTTQAGLAGSSAYQAAGTNYSYSNVFVGLESRSDTFSYSGNTLTFTITSKDPGDHIRVLTAPVPEPTTYALMAAGLLAVGFAVKRRSDNS